MEWGEFMLNLWAKGIKLTRQMTVWRKQKQIGISMKDVDKNKKKRFHKKSIGERD